MDNEDIKGYILQFISQNHTAETRLKKEEAVHI